MKKKTYSHSYKKNQITFYHFFWLLSFILCSTSSLATQLEWKEAGNEEYTTAKSVNTNLQADTSINIRADIKISPLFIYR